jgi:hypothetical protein
MKKKEMRDFWSEFNYPLDQVQRVWLRRLVIIALFPIFTILGAFFGAINLTRDWFNESW